MSKKVIVIGLDGLEPRIVEPMLAAGELPNLARLREQGGYSRVATTYPAQTPVAWSTFATGTNPGGHGIFDFIRRDPTTYLPDISLNRYEQKNPFLPPTAVNLRRGTPVWEVLSQAAIESIVIRCPCTYPPDSIRGRVLAGMGVPDVRGGMGSSTYYSTAEDVRPQESENVVRLNVDDDRTITTYLMGPRNPKSGSDLKFEITLQVDPSARRIVLRSAGKPKELELREGQWSDWLKLKFKAGFLQSVRGMVRFHLVRTQPQLELYASPINFDPDRPMFPISSPPQYVKELADRQGTFHTTGMVEDHSGLNNGRLNEAAFLDQCEIVLREREKMMLCELERFEEGMLFCLFDSPDRVGHMFWRFCERDHPANDGAVAREMKEVIEDHYRACDAIVGEAMQFADDDTLFVALSDHGMRSFRRGVHLNTWLYNNGLLALRNGAKPGEEAGDLLRRVDWSRTRAYALGLSGIYLNLRGREREGIVTRDQALAVRTEIAERLSGLTDSDRGEVAVRTVLPREKVYAGPYVAEAPDLVVNFSEGYRISWGTAIGAIPAGLFEDNTRKWSGDHIIDPCLVPGVLFMNRTFHKKRPHLVDLAPTILQALAVPKGPEMEGDSLIS